MNHFFDYIYYRSFKIFGWGSEDINGHNLSFKTIIGLKLFMMLNFFILLDIFYSKGVIIFNKQHYIVILIISVLLIEIFEHSNKREKSILLFDERYKHLSKWTQILDITIIYLLLGLLILTPVFMYSIR